MDYQTFYKVVRQMRKHLPILYPIHVRRVRMPKGDDGDCEFKKDKFRIRIEKTLPENYAIDVLLHELAHALDWDSGEHSDDEHGPTWGEAYSAIYRHFLVINQ